MSEDARTVATELRAPRGASTLEIDWADGVTSKLSHEILRGFCPCAECQGHQGPVVFKAQPSSKNLELGDIEEVGTYAIRLVWGDGHGTGLFSFRFLRALGDRSLLGGDPQEWSFSR